MENEEKLEQEQEQEFQLPYTVKLSYPIEYGKRTISEITFQRRPRAGDVRQMSVQNQTFGDILNIVSKCTAQPTSVVERMDLDDVSECARIVNSFLSSGTVSG